jgi:hypothetical protein
MAKRPKAPLSTKEELLALKNEAGMIIPAEVVEWAEEHPESRLYKKFEWDNEKAGHEHRLWQARQLIALEIVYKPGGSRQMVSLTIDRTNRQGGGYRDIAEVVEVPSLRECLLEDAFAEFARFKKKFERLEEMERVWEAFEDVEKAVRAYQSARRQRPKSQAEEEGDETHPS